MAWNSAESFIDAVLLAGLGLRARVGLDVIARISAIDAKLALIKSIGEGRLGISGEVCDGLRKALDCALHAAKELKGYRDAVIHSQVVDPSEGLGQLIKRDGQYDVLLSQEALDGLYHRLISVRDELRTVCLIFLILNEGAQSDEQVDLKTLLRGPEVQAHVAQVRERQKARLSLSPLPKFPK
jgi:hypothetical protein